MAKRNIFDPDFEEESDEINVGFMDVVREVPGVIKRGLTATRKFLLPTRREELSQIEKEFGRKLTDEEAISEIQKREMGRGTIGVFNSFQTKDGKKLANFDNVDQFLDSPRLDIGGFAGSMKTKGAKVVKEAVEEAPTAIKKLITAIRGATKPQKALEEAQTAERAIRAQKVAKTFEEAKGKAGFIQAKGQLAGELATRPKFQPLTVVDNVAGTTPKAGLDIVPEGDRKFLSDLSAKIKGKTDVTETDIDLAKSIFKENGLNIPDNPKAFADQIELLEQTALDSQMTAAMNKKITGPMEITQKDVDNLFNQIQGDKYLDVYDKISAADGLDKLFRGELPPPSQLKQLETIFGSDLVKAVMEKRSGIEKFKDVVTNALNLPRALMTTFDMSAVMRQGVVLTTTRPKSAVRAMGEMFRQTFSQKNFDEWLRNLPRHQFYKEMKDGGLYIADPTKLAGGLTAREERFMTNYAQYIPGIGALTKASERAYVSYLNKIRVDTFSTLLEQFKKDGIATPENIRSLANFVNNASGRGSMGAFERVAQELNTVFFSPRLIASRFNMLNPVWYAKQTPPVRKEAIKTMLQFVATGATVLGIAKLGGADVEIDPRSTDFGKAKVGNTRFDVWGGFQQWVRVITQIASGQRKSTTSGKIIDIDKKKFPFESRLDVAERFIRGKLAPIPSLTLELLDGQKLFGEELSLQSELVENTIPLYIQDLAEAIREFGPEAIITVGGPAFFGIGTQTYSKKKENSSKSNPF